jgi:hypothetical protein
MLYMQVDGAAEDAAAASTTGRSVAQRVSALEWRTEQVQSCWTHAFHLHLPSEELSCGDKVYSRPSPRTHAFGSSAEGKCTALHDFGTFTTAAVQVATACTASSRQTTCRAQQARSSLAAVRETAGLAEAKVLQHVMAALHHHHAGMVAVTIKPLTAQCCKN